jgi:hypothetical protein
MRLSAWCAAAAVATVASGAFAIQGSTPSPKDNEDLARLFKEDQDDRKPGVHGMDWTKVKPRDDARLAWEPGTEPGTFRLAPVDSRMTDELRQALGAPTLAEAKAMETRFNKK